MCRKSTCSGVVTKVKGEGKIDVVLYLSLNIIKNLPERVKIMGNLCLKNKEKNKKFARLPK